jgi:hypothetical protein
MTRREAQDYLRGWSESARAVTGEEKTPCDICGAPAEYAVFRGDKPGEVFCSLHCSRGHKEVVQVPIEVQKMLCPGCGALTSECKCPMQRSDPLWSALGRICDLQVEVEGPTKNRETTKPVTVSVATGTQRKTTAKKSHKKLQTDCDLCGHSSDAKLSECPICGAYKETAK